MSEGTSSLLNAVYVSSAEGEKILRRLTKAAGFTTDNIVSRLAIARSLAEPASPEPAPDWETHRGGKQIKGYTLLGRQEVATSLLAMIVEASGERLTLDQLRHRVRLHWEHGLRLMDREVRKADIETTFLDYAERAVLSERRTRARSLVSSRRVLSEHVVGQLQAKKLLEEVLDKATDYEPATLLKPLCIVGPSGYGKRTLASGMAKSLQLSFVELPARDCGSPDAILALLDLKLASDGLTPEIGKSGRVDYPEALVYVSEAQTLPTPQLQLLLALRPNRNYQKFADQVLRMQAGALVFGSDRVLSNIHGIELATYSISDVAEIVGRVIGKWPLEMRKLLAVAGRYNPATAIALGQEMLEVARTTTTSGRPSEGLLLEVMERRWGMDRLGLTEANYRFMTGVAHDDPSDEQDGEPAFLERLGFVRWRDDRFVITDRGKEVLDVWQQFRS